MEYTHACEEAAPQSSHKDFCNKHPKDSNKLGDRQDAAELRRVATLRRQHAEHLLEVVKKAEKREQERQKKLRHAPNKTHSEYLLKRFDVERLQDQAQISELLQDARAVEVASSQPKQPSITSTKSSKGSTSKTRQEGGAVEYGSLEGGDESFAGVSGNNMAVGSSGSNAYVEPSEVREDPDFISTDKMGFLKYVYKAVDNHKTCKSNAKLAAELAASRAKKQYCMGNSPRVVDRRGKASSSTSRYAREESSKGRRRLLEQKRGILLELKGVVSRQADALDRLAEGCDTGTSASSRRTSTTSSRASSLLGRHNSDGIVVDLRRDASSYRDGMESTSRGHHRHHTSAVCSTVPPHSSIRSGRTYCTDSSSGNSNAIKPQRRLSPPTQPENDATSNFLSMGGRWGKAAKYAEADMPTSGHRSSIASSASYASYGGRGDSRRNGAKYCAELRVNKGGCRIPKGVPALPIGRQKCA